MDKEKELLLTNNKEWLVDEIIRERRSYHAKMMANIEFHNNIINNVNELLCTIKTFHEYGIDRIKQRNAL